ncbi:MAG: Ig-like domain-containing protein, partial [Gemmatimonadota bacterium]
MPSWDAVATLTFDALAAPRKRLTIYRAMSSAPGSGPITVTFSKAQSNCQWIVSQWDGVATGGVNGAGAIGQVGSNAGDAVNGLAVALAAFANSGNVAYGAFAVNRNALAITPGSGFAEIAEVPSGENTAADLQAQWATNLNAIAANWSALNGGALGVEIQAGAPPAPVVSVGVTPSQASVPQGGTVQLTATPRDAGGNPLPGRVVTWKSSDTAVA